MTPYQFGLCQKGYKRRKERDHDHAAWVMWHNALLSGVSGKKFPKLDMFMSNNKKSKKSVDESSIKAWLKAYSKRYEEANAGSKT